MLAVNSVSDFLNFFVALSLRLENSENILIMFLVSIMFSLLCTILHLPVFVYEVCVCGGEGGLFLFTC